MAVGFFPLMHASLISRSNLANPNVYDLRNIKYKDISN